MRLSIIIPVYKAEKYLAECLDSIFCQNVPDIEVITVNDGSPDRSLNILRDYERRYPSLRVIDQPNQGVSVARNAGLNVATGEYIMFVDPDDRVEPTINKLLEEARNAGDPDLVIAGYTSISASGVRSSHKLPHAYFDNRTDALNTLMDYDFNLYMAPWSKMYNANIIHKYESQFTPGLKIFEDTVFNCNYMTHIQNILLSNTMCYMYQLHSSNTTNSFFCDKHFEYIRLRSHTLRKFYNECLSGSTKQIMLEKMTEYDSTIWITVIYALYRSRTSHRLHWLRRIFQEAPKYNPRWLDYYTYNVPKLIARIGPRSLTLCHLILLGIFKADKLRKSIRKQ